MDRRSPVRRSSAGFTLVETMVAVVIGMLITFIVMQIYATSEGQKRTITYGADAQSDAAVALYMIERDLRQAGYGLSANPEDFTPAYTANPGAAPTSGVLAQCTSVTTSTTSRGAITYANSTFAPVVINPKLAGGAAFIPAGDANTDVILVNYGAAQGMIGKAVLFKTDPAGNTTQTGGTTPDYVVDAVNSSRFGFQQGDLVLAVPPGATAGGCNVVEITGLPGGTGTACTVSGADLNQVFINHNAVQYPSYYTGCDPGNLTTATWNPGGEDTAFAAGSKLYNLGPVGSFVSRAYAVRNGVLTVCDLTVSDCTAVVADPPDPTIWVPVANGVLGLRAQYGRDANFNGAIDSWDQTTQLGAARAEIAAVRLALVVRSGQFDKAYTAPTPVWRQDAVNTTDSNFVTTGWSSDWQGYRYKAAQSIVPVRNMIWGEQIN